MAKLYVKCSELFYRFLISLFPLHQLLQHGLGHLHSDDLPFDGDNPIGKKPFFDDNLATFEFFDPSAHFELHAERGGFVVVNMQRGSEEARVGFGVRVLLFHGAVHGRGGSAGAVTVDQRGEQAAVDKPRHGDVIRLGQEVANRFVTVPVTFDLVSVLVEFATAITVGEGVGVVVLKGGLGHEAILV